MLCLGVMGDQAVSEKVKLCLFNVDAVFALLSRKRVRVMPFHASLCGWNGGPQMLFQQICERLELGMLD